MEVSVAKFGKRITNAECFNLASSFTLFSRRFGNFIVLPEQGAGSLRNLTGVITLLAIFGAGCGHPNPKSDDGQATAAVLIDDAAASHDFGPVISRMGRKLDHQYSLRNQTSHDVTIVNVINRKTCCGTVRVGKRILHPGDSTTVDVALSVSDKLGSVVHETEVVTEPISLNEIVLRTSADAHPALRVEGESSSSPTVILGSEKSQQVGFQIFACGTASEPPVDLDRLVLRSSVKAEWDGPKQNAPGDDGLIVESRRFLVGIEPSGPPGDRKAEVVLVDGEQRIFRHELTWEVASAITASPKLVVFKPGERTSRVLIRSGDQKAFRVKRVECQAIGVHGRAESTAAAVSQVIEIEGSPKPGDGRGVVTVFTDHPSQEEVVLPFVVID